MSSHHETLTVPNSPSWFRTKSEEQIYDLKKQIPDPEIWKRRFSDTLYPPDLPVSLAVLDDYKEFYIQGLEDNETSPTQGKCHYEILAGKDGIRIFIASEHLDSTSKDFKLSIYDHQGEVVLKVTGLLEDICRTSIVEISVPTGGIGHIIQGDRPWHPMYTILNWQSQEVLRLQHPKHKKCCSSLQTYFEPTDIHIYGDEHSEKEIGTINKYLPRDVHLLSIIRREREDSIKRSKGRHFSTAGQSRASVVQIHHERAISIPNHKFKFHQTDDIRNLQHLESDITNQSIGMILHERVDLYLKIMMICSLFVLDYRLVRNRIDDAPRKNIAGKCSRYCGIYLAVFIFCLGIFVAVVFVFIYYGKNYTN